MNEELRDMLNEVYETLDKAWGPLNSGQTQCSCCATAYAYVDEVMTAIRTELATDQEPDKEGGDNE